MAWNSTGLGAGNLEHSEVLTFLRMLKYGCCTLEIKTNLHMERKAKLRSKGTERNRMKGTSARKTTQTFLWRLGGSGGSAAGRALWPPWKEAFGPRGWGPRRDMGGTGASALKYFQQVLPTIKTDHQKTLRTPLWKTTWKQGNRCNVSICPRSPVTSRLQTPSVTVTVLKCVLWRGWNSHGGFVAALPFPCLAFWPPKINPQLFMFSPPRRLRAGLRPAPSSKPGLLVGARCSAVRAAEGGKWSGCGTVLCYLLCSGPKINTKQELWKWRE